MAQLLKQTQIRIRGRGLPQTNVPVQSRGEDARLAPVAGIDHPVMPVAISRQQRQRNPLRRVNPADDSPQKHSLGRRVLGGQTEHRAVRTGAKVVHDVGGVDGLQTLQRL